MLTANGSLKEAIPTGGTVQEMIEFFDTHDMGDQWDDLPDAQFDVDIETKRHMVEIDKEILFRTCQIPIAKFEALPHNRRGRREQTRRSLRRKE